MEGERAAGAVRGRGRGGLGTITVALAVSLALSAAPAGAQMFRTLATVGGPGEPDPIGTVVSLEVHPGDGRVRIVGDSGRVHHFTPTGRRVRGAGAAEGWGAATPPAAGALSVELSGGVRVAATADSAAFRITRTEGDSAVDDRVFRLPAAGEGGEGEGAPFRIHRLLADGTGRAWLLACPSGGCGGQERWIVLRPPPEPGEGPSLNAVVPPARFRLEAVRGSRMYGVQGVPGRQLLHVLELYERAG